MSQRPIAIDDGRITLRIRFHVFTVKNDRFQARKLRLFSLVCENFSAKNLELVYFQIWQTKIGGYFRLFHWLVYPVKDMIGKSLS